MRKVVVEAEVYHMGLNTLKLLSTKTFSSGVVALHYEPQR